MRKTAYEMRISDWSSDVCSSDLPSGSRALTARRLLGTEARAGGNDVSGTGDGEARPISSAMAWRAAMRLPGSGWVEHRQSRQVPLGQMEREAAAGLRWRHALGNTAAAAIRLDEDRPTGAGRV